MASAAWKWGWFGSPGKKKRMSWQGEKSSDHKNVSREASGKDQTECPELQNLQVCSAWQIPPNFVTALWHCDLAGSDLDGDSRNPSGNSRNPHWI